MPSYIPELFNTDPYYDDFNQDKKFLRIMFRPGYGVQARELTQLQTILQNQIERFGSHVFEEGSIVTGGKITVNSLKYARVSGLSGTTDINDFLGLAANSTSRARTRIIHVEEGLTSSSVDNLNVIYFDYLEGGNGLTFGDVIGATAADGSYITANITGSWAGSGPYPVGNALLVSVEEGVRFAEGFFVYHETQQLGAYTLTGSAGNQIRMFENPTTRMGFSVDKSFADYQTDTTLNDPAYGSYNYNAPGADRFVIDLNLTQNGFTASNTSAVDNFSRTDFIEFLRLVNGSPIKIEKYPDYAMLEDTLARRTYDESGNYTVRPFEINVSNGTGLTNDSATAVLNVDLEPGKAYIFGYEFETQGVTRLGLTAPRDANHIRTVESVFSRSVGPYCQVEFSGITGGMTGFLGFDRQQTVYLSRGLSGTVLDQVGTARLRSINHYSGSVFNLGIYNVEMSGTAGFDDVTRIFVAATGSTHAFAITGNSGLIGTAYGDLLYVIPSGTRCKRVTDGDYAVSAVADDRTIGPVPSNGFLTFTMNTTEYAASNNDAGFSIGNTIVAIPSSEITVFDSIGPIGGTAVRGASDDQLVITLSGRGVTTGNKIYITTSLDIKDVTPPLRRNKTLATTSITGSGFTGAFAGLTADQYGNRVLYLGGLVDVTEVVSLTGVRDEVATQVKNFFAFDNGQRDNLYDWSRMTLIAGTTGVTGPFTATVKRYTRSGSVGPFTVDSYNSGSYSSIPDYTSRTTGKTYNLADVIDFRPDRGLDGNIMGSPWIPTNTSANDSIFTYEHYLARTDKIVLNRDRTFSVIQGIPSLDGVVPPDDPNAMTLYTVAFNPYTYDKDDVSVRYVDNRRYTMRDIANLEKRVEAVEYYTTLSLLEQDAKSLSVADSDTGLEMPKKGILVDQFKGHNIGDVSNPMYAASIDFERNELRPPFETRVFGLSGPESSSGTVVSPDGIVTLGYGATAEIAQPLATSTTVINPSSVFNYLGTLSLSPAGDFWFDTGLTPSVRVNVDGENDAWNVGRFGSQWNDWESIWYGREVQSESNTKLNITTKNSVIAGLKGLDLGNTFKSGVPEGIKQKSVSKVARKDVIPFNRDNGITLSAMGLKPKTRFYVFLDDKDITPACTGATQFTDDKGACSVFFNTGTTGYRTLTGKRSFRITDSPTNVVSGTSMAADAIYSSVGFLDTLSEDGILATRPATIRRRSVKSNKIQSNLTELLSTDFFGYTEPLSQTFFVDPIKYPDGIFVKYIGVAFSAKSSDNNIPVTLLLKPTTSGYPHPSKIMPFGQSTIYGNDITTSTDGSAESTFNFTSPIYLLPGNEYAISLVTNSSDFAVYKATVGDNIINLVDGVADRKATKQPAMRSMFLPQNTGSLKKSDIESLRFSVGVCVFSPESGSATYETKTENYSGSTLFDLGRINVNHVLPSRTSVTFTDLNLVHPSITRSVQVNKNFDRESDRVRTLADKPILGMNFIGTRYVSPVVDVQTSNYVVVRNKINNNIVLANNSELFPTNFGATSPSEARYITKQVILEQGFEATDAVVQMSLSNPYNTSVQVFIRPLPVGEGDFTNIMYQQMTRTDTGPTYTPNADTFQEVTYKATSLNLTKFRAFSIKVVMYSDTIDTDPRSLPRIKNLRIVAV